MRDNDAQLIWEAYVQEAVIDSEMQLSKTANTKRPTRTTYV